MKKFFKKVSKIIGNVVLYLYLGPIIIYVLSTAKDPKEIEKAFRDLKKKHNKGGSFSRRIKERMGSGENTVVSLRRENK